MPSPDAPRPSRAPFYIAVAASIVAIAAIAWASYLKIEKPMERQVSSNNAVAFKLTGLTSPVVNKLATIYTDADNDLVADTPANLSNQSDPRELSFSYVATANPDQFQDKFKELLEALSKATGKPVKYVPMTDTDDELRAMRDGKLQIAAFGTGTVPLAVDACGFVPLCRTGGRHEDGDHMLIIVPADSTIKSLPELKGHELGVTEPSSNSGYKAALVTLSRDTGLRPGEDFTLRFSGGQETSIGHIADKSYEAAAVSSDVLERGIADGRIGRDAYHVLYTSELFPTAAIGVTYTLKPQLVDEIKKTLLDFNWDGTGLIDLFGATGETKFIPVNFKNDWALVRRIDDAIGSAHVLK